MATLEVLKPIADASGMPVDPNVRIPDHVSRASQTADQIHQQFYPKDEAQPAAPAKEAVPQPAQPEPLHTPEPTVAAPAPQPVAAEHPQTPQPGDENVSADEWRHRFLSMQGRYNAAKRENGAMEEQMRQLGQELVRTQEMVSQAYAQPSPQNPKPGHDHNNLITAEDRENYGDQLIDLTQRAARAAVAPELDALRAENQNLTKQVRNTGKREMFARMDAAIPQWRAINNDVRFITWLRLPNVYTGQIRSQMLKAAVDGAEAPKVIALFKDFLAEAQATGQTAPAPQAEQQPAPRAPAVNLETLAAPGRARPASGDNQVPSEKPLITRAMISKFYDDKRRQLYAGREAEAAAFEADLTAAQREGRVR